MANTSFLITELDYSQILTNLQNFMAGQSIFSDYNFAGSGLQALLRELALNTHYGAVYVNMMANELGISTAQIRDNIVNLAKSLNYVPVSMTSPSAFINIIVTPPQGNTQTTLLLPRYTSFQSQAINGVNYNYVTTSAYTATLANGQFLFSNVEIQEGIVVSYNYTASTTNPRNVFNIPNANIDTSTLLVTVTENTPSPPQNITYLYSTDVSLLTGNSRVYFLEGAENNTYNIYFGDGVLGRALIPGDVVNTIYLNTNGDASNQANGFTLMASIGGFTNTVIQSISASGGGAQAESNDSIKSNAPVAYTTQERAVTLADYNFLLNRDYPNIGSMALWGGDKNNPPVYGKTFIAIRPKIGNYLSNNQKQQIINILSKYTLQTESNTPQIVDPDYTYLLYNADVTYNPNKTNLNQTQLLAAIKSMVVMHSQTNLGKFNGICSQSDLNDAIISADPSITGVASETYLQKRFFPTLNQNLNYILNFYTQLHQGGASDPIYSSPAGILLDSFGNPQVCYIEENTPTYQSISNYIVNNPGFGYTGIPEVVITGDGQGATAHAVVVNQAVQSIITDTVGQGYNFANVKIVGGGGYNASVTPVLSQQLGILQTFFYTNSNKVFITRNQGSVDHLQGIVKINNFAPTGVDNLSGQLTINARPASDIIVPAKNNILLFDPNDPGALSINLIPLTM